MTDEQRWGELHPDEKLPGSAEPLEGKCGARLKNKELKELGITRYCYKTAGMGTNHLGAGTCKWHLGNTAKHTTGAVQTVMKKELATLSEQLGEPTPLGPPEVEAFQLASKMKQWTLILEDKMSELNGILEVTDKAGVEHVRALIEVMERAWERWHQFLLLSLGGLVRNFLPQKEEVLFLGFSCIKVQAHSRQARSHVHLGNIPRPSKCI